jgi:hypothetical protein
MYYSAALWCSTPFPSNPSMGAEMLMARWRLVAALIVGQGTGHKVHLSCGWSGALALRSTRATLGLSLFAWLIIRQPAVLFSHNKPATSNQPTILFFQNKSAPAISHQPNEQANRSCKCCLSARCRGFSVWGGLNSYSRLGYSGRKPW